MTGKSRPSAERPKAEQLSNVRRDLDRQAIDIREAAHTFCASLAILKGLI